AAGDLGDAGGDLVLRTGKHFVGTDLLQLGGELLAAHDVDGAKAEMFAELDDHPAQSAASAGLQEPAAARDLQDALGHDDRGGGIDKKGGDLIIGNIIGYGDDVARGEID